MLVKDLEHPFEGCSRVVVHEKREPGIGNRVFQWRFRIGGRNEASCHVFQLRIRYRTPRQPLAHPEVHVEIPDRMERRRVRMRHVQWNCPISIRRVCLGKHLESFPGNPLQYVFNSFYRVVRLVR